MNQTDGERGEARRSAVDDIVLEDPEAFLSRVGADLVAALTVKTGDRHLAEELATEAIARAWRDWAKVSMMQNPTGWVFRVGFNLAASHWRRVMIARRIDAAAPSRERHVHLRTAESLVVRDAISTLSERQQQVVILRFFLQFTVEETAEVLGVGAGTVKTQSSRALHKLRRLLGEERDDGNREHGA